ncbi:uncharacterized protein LOC129011302 [Pongo pygmaeus]|uniref:uncharacterized protein LOC129011302 n=1 Tax=Pongo pygmaeus TaxID=9600 RepID=UPI00300DAD7E
MRAGWAQSHRDPDGPVSRVGSAQHPEHSGDPEGPVILLAQTCPAGSRPVDQQGPPSADPWAGCCGPASPGGERTATPWEPRSFCTAQAWLGAQAQKRRFCISTRLNTLMPSCAAPVGLPGTSVGSVSTVKHWAEFSGGGFRTYLQLEYLERANALARQKEVSFLLPAVLRRLSYGGPVLRILSMPDDTLIMIREDGAIYFWSLQLKLKRRKRVFDKSTSRNPRWMTDVISMLHCNKLIIRTSRVMLLFNPEMNNRPRVVAHACNSSTLGSRGRQII